MLISSNSTEINRRSFLWNSASVLILLGLGVRASAQSQLCAVYSDGVVTICDDPRTPGSQPGEGGGKLSPTPWHTWNNEALRQWDADLLRWNAVRDTTGKQVEALATALNKNASGGTVDFPDLRQKLSNALTALAQKYISDPPLAPSSIRQYWHDIGDAKNGLSKAVAVNRALTRAVIDGNGFQHLNGVVNENGLLTGTALNDVVSKVRVATQPPTRYALVVAGLNFMLVVDTALADISSISAELQQRSASILANNRLNIIAGLALIGDAGEQISARAASTWAELSRSLNNFVQGYSDGLARSATEVIQALELVVTQPVFVARSVGALLLDSPRIMDGIDSFLQKSSDTLLNGTAQERGELLGSLSVDVLAAMLGEEVANGAVKAADLGTVTLRKSTDQILLLGAARRVEAIAEKLVSPVRGMGDYLSDGVKALLKYQADTDSVLNQLRAFKLEFDEYLEIKLLPNGQLSPAAQGLLKAWNEIVADTNRILKDVSEFVNPETGTVYGLSNAKELIDRISVLERNGQISNPAMRFAERRYADAFEESVRLRMGGVEKYYVIDGSEVQFDILTKDYLIQASVNPFDRPNAVVLFETNKLNQVINTANKAAEEGVKSAYYFRSKPPDEIIQFLRDRGINDVWWDLP